MNSRTTHKILAWAAALLFSLGAGRQLDAWAAQAAQGLTAKDYKIGPKDLLEIKVFEIPELSNITVRVSEDGSITLPLLQNVIVEGLTKDEVENKLALLLKEKYVRNPQVSVFIKEYQSKRVAIIGAISKPGLYEIVGRLNVLTLIAQAGGLADNAANEIFVQREELDGANTVLAIDLEELWTSKNPKLNLDLQPNDVVNIPKEKTVHIYVFGEVKTPGALPILNSQKIWLSQAIAQAGGPTENAAISRTTIKRRVKTGRETNMTVNLKDILKGKKPDILLQEGDVVFVPESIF